MSTPPAQTPTPLRDLWTLLRDAEAVQYYATVDGVPPGQVLHIAASDWTHECWIFNPDDWASFPPIAGVRWAHLRDAPPKWGLLSTGPIVERSDEWGALRLRGGGRP